MRLFLTMLFIGASFTSTPAFAQDAPTTMTFGKRHPTRQQIARVVEILVAEDQYEKEVLRPRILENLVHQHQDLIAQAREIKEFKAKVADLEAKLEQIILVVADNNE